MARSLRDTLKANAIEITHSQKQDHERPSWPSATIWMRCEAAWGYAALCGDRAWRAPV